MAIWNMTFNENEDLDLLAANLVHEMFHCFQAEKGESRYPDDLELLTYPLDSKNFQMKAVENRLLADFIHSKDEQLLRQFVYLRLERERLIGHHFYNELLVETVEGAAEFVGLQALRQLAPEKYEKRLMYYLEQLTRLSDEIFAVRRQAYYTGTLLLIVLSEKKHENLEHKDPLYLSLIADIVPERFIYSLETGVTELLTKEVARRRATLASFDQAKNLTGKITGYDPMNMFRLDDWLYCANFVKIGDNFLSGPVLLEVEPSSIDRVHKYYLKK
ncbi:hypothetical protein [Jeotgalibaca sp. A127]|uniref:hypothetical protein n=1 Tax=Jeotgalibaca sp. A127 TaxID=3457324 RepID=UPI003FD66AAA